MKTLRVYMIIGFLNALIGFFLSFYFFSKNLSTPVKQGVSYPFDTFSMYRLLPSGQVQVNIIHILLAAIILAIPITFIVIGISRVIRTNLNNQGRI